MQRQKLLVWCVFGLACSGCASHGAVHVAPDESRPHITWEIRSGGDQGDKEFVCGSVRPPSPCALAASTASKGMMTTVRVYLHAAAEETSYLGVLALPFLEGVGLGKREINMTVPRGSRPVSFTIIARVSSKPGSYTFGVQLDATQAKMPDPMRIVIQIPVTVK